MANTNVKRVKTSDLELKDRLVAIQRVTKVTKGGRHFRFAAIVVVGDENGVVGYGLGKANEVTAAIAKGVEDAKKNLVKIPVINTTIPHEQEAKFGGSRVFMKPAAPGTGVKAGGAMRAVFESVGVQNAAKTGHGVGVTHLGEREDRRLDEVVRVGRTLALSKHVLHTCTLEHGTHSTTGLYTGTGSCGFHEHLGSAECSFLLVRDGCVDDGNLDQVLLCIFNTLCDSGSNFVGFSKTIAYNAVLVTYDYDSSKAEVTTTLGNLGYALDGNEPVLQFEVRRLYSLYICICHSLLY